MQSMHRNEYLFLLHLPFCSFSCWLLFLGVCSSVTAFIQQKRNERERGEREREERKRCRCRKWDVVEVELNTLDEEENKRTVQTSADITESVESLASRLVGVVVFVVVFFSSLFFFAPSSSPVYHVVLESTHKWVSC